MSKCTVETLIPCAVLSLNATVSTILRISHSENLSRSRAYTSSFSCSGTTPFLSNQAAHPDSSQKDFML